MGYDEFSQRFLAALYFETEQTGKQFHKARNLLSKYGLSPKPHWIARIADDWENWYFRDISKVLSSYEDWDFRISGEGSRKVEDDFRDEAELIDFLKPKQTDINVISAQLAPAAGRMVSLSDNSVLRGQLTEGIAEIEEKISASNEIDPNEKADVIESLSLAKRLVQASTKILVGAFNYLVIERLKKAFEKTIEDTFRVSIVAILGALALSIMAAF